VGEPACVKAAEVVCSMVTTDVVGCCGVEAMTGAVVEIMTVDGTGAGATGVEAVTVDETGAGGIGVDGIGVDVDGVGVEGVGVDGGAESIVVPAGNEMIPLHVSPLGQHPPVTHWSPALQ
jgi:hypothetical protein